MKTHSTLIFLISLLIWSCRMEKATRYLSFNEYPVYEGGDLGLTYTPGRSVFRLWSPPATAVHLSLYAEGNGGEPLRTIEMQSSEQGTWLATVDEDLLGQYYTFQVRIDGEWLAEVPDPYAAAVGVNGRRAMVVDLAGTDPEGWEADRRPPLREPNAIIIYELHVRDATIHPNSGAQHRGKFLGLSETGTRGPEGVATGLDHLRELGITHVHLLPAFDFRSIDEANPGDRYNWGYDPQNYNTPEGTYATDARNGAVRIREFKQLIKAFHENGLRVIMDVVYNHTGDTEMSNFNQLVPGYYYRQNQEGGFSDASACGNEVASERAMTRKFIIESVEYWAREYHVDGFRFDLMGIHDIETMNQVAAALHRIDPTIVVYGEGWTAGASPLPDSLRALKTNTSRLGRVAAFSDDIRDAIKGHVFTHNDPGFASGKAGLEESIKFGVAASIQHPQIDYSKVRYSQAPWALEPYQTITYVSCHDNHTLWDRLLLSVPDADEAERIRMHKLAGAIVLTSQGISFLHAGVELARTKGGVENSFESPDSINRIDWSRKVRFADVFDFYRSLIALRKNHPAFRMTSSASIREHLEFLDFPEDSLLVGYLLKEHANGDPWRNILVLFNGNREGKEVEIPAGRWTVVLDGATVDEGGITMVENGKINMPASAALILIQE